MLGDGVFRRLIGCLPSTAFEQSIVPWQDYDRSPSERRQDANVALADLAWRYQDRRVQEAMPQVRAELDQLLLVSPVEAIELAAWIDPDGALTAKADELIAEE
jgi:hypothetical protein